MDREKEKQIDAQIEKLRKDPDFQRRLKHAMDENREALDLLAKGEEEQVDQ